MPRIGRTLFPLLIAPALYSLGCDRSASGPIYLVDRISSAEASFDPVRHRSFRKDSRLSASITFDGETRRALTPPYPSVITFPIRLPTDAILTFAMGVETFGGAGSLARVLFRVWVESAAGRQTVFEERLGPGQVDRWLDREVDLGPYSDSPVKLGFQTETREKPSGQKGERVAVAGVLPVWGHPVVSGGEGASQQPNLILISLDCVRADHVGAYGYSRQTTPHVDGLAADGVVFETAVSTAPDTLASHVSMLTGLPRLWHGATNWEGFSPSVPYLPELLAEAGYESAGVVSAPWLSGAFGVERGYHVYRALDQPRAETVIDSALDLLERAENRRQFLFIHLFDAHWPYIPPRELIERFGERPPDISELMDRVGREEPPFHRQEVEQLIRLYDAEVAYTDQQVGRFLDRLRETDRYGNSLVAVVSDHGEAFYERGHWQHSVSVYEELVRVALIVKWPGMSPTGRIKAPVSLVDIFATFLEQAGRQAASTESQSLKRFFAGSGEESAHGMVVSEVGWKPKPTSAPLLKISFRDGNLKYIATLSGSVGALDPLAVGEIRKEELYDLSQDPSERKNIAADSSTKPYRRALQAYLEKARVLRAGRQGRPLILDDALKEKLRSLGYVNY